MNSTPGFRREKVMREIVEFLAQRERQGQPVERREIEEAFPQATDDPDLSDQLDSVLSMPEWFSQSTIEASSREAPLRRERSISKWGGYLLLEEIGSGGMGQVFKAWEIEVGRFVALKRIRPERLHEERTCQRFREEPEHVRKLDHEAIVPILDVGEVDDCPYFTMELIQGTSLVNLARHQALPRERVAEMMMTISESVAVAHEAGVLHRDLKPANILLTTDLQPRLVDFGLAKDLQAETELTGSLVLGTLNYMSPEQAAGQLATERTDVYGLGAILYELLTARPPFRGISPAELLLRVQQEGVQAPRQVNVHVDPQLEAICLKCLEKDPAMRYASAQELAEEFSRVLQGQRQRAPYNTLPRRLLRRAKQRPAVAALITMMLVTAIVCTVLISKIVFQNIETRTQELETRLARSQASAARQREELVKAIGLENDASNLVRQGDWQQALAILDQAIESGHPVPDRLRIEIAKNYLHLNQNAESFRRLQEVLESDLTDRHRATALMWQGHLLLGHKDKLAMESLQAAEQHRNLLDPADREFLSGLLAQQLTSAATHFQKAVVLQPHHHEARRMLATSYFFLGRLQDCRDQANICRVFAPQDIPIMMLEAVAAGLEGDHNGAVLLLDEATGTAYEDAVPQLLRALDIIKEFRDVKKWSSLSKVQIAVKLMPFLTALQGKSNPEWGRVPLPPQIRRIYMPVVGKLIRYMVLGKSSLKTLRSELITATNDVKEGTMLYLLGEIELRLGMFKDSAKTFEAAYQAPSLLDVKNRLQYVLARVKWQLSAAAQGKEKTRLQDQSADYVQQFVRSEIRAVVTSADLLQLGEVALVRNDLALAREIALNWWRRFPNDFGPDLLLGVANLKRERFLVALGHLKTARTLGCRLDKLPGYIKTCEDALAKPPTATTKTATSAPESNSHGKAARDN